MNWKYYVGSTLVIFIAVSIAVWMIIPALVVSPIIMAWLWWQARKLKNLNQVEVSNGTNHNYTR